MIVTSIKFVCLSVCLQCLSVCPSVGLSVCPSVCLSVCLSVFLSVFLFVYLTFLSGTWCEFFKFFFKFTMIFLHKSSRKFTKVHHWNPPPPPPPPDRSFSRWGGGGPTTKKIMPPGKTQDVLCLFCSFLFFFKTRSKSTFLCPIWSKCVLKKEHEKRS